MECHFNKRDQEKECSAECRFYETCVWSAIHEENRVKKVDVNDEQ